MTKLKKVLLSAAVGAAMAGAGFSASAATTNLGAANIGTPLAFGGIVPAAGGFIDDFLFTLPANGGSGYSVVNFPLSIPGLGNFNILLTGMALFSDADATPWNGNETLLNSVAGGPNSLGLTFGATGGGNMILQVSGTANGSLGGLYNGAISVSPVPEPETWAMMLIGAGLVGFQLRRRAKQSATQRLV